MEGWEALYLLRKNRKSPYAPTGPVRDLLRNLIAQAKAAQETMKRIEFWNAGVRPSTVYAVMQAVERLEFEAGCMVGELENGFLADEQDDEGNSRPIA